MMFWKKKSKRETGPRDPFESLFGGMDSFESIEKMMDEMMKDMMSGSRLERPERKPLVMGFSMRMGEDGVPRIEEFGNVKVQREGEPKVSKSREPLMDLVEEPRAVTITAELPGISEKELELKFEGKRLLIKADSKENSFRKEVDLPTEVNPKEMKKSFKNGVLELIVPKKAPSKAKNKSA